MLLKESVIENWAVALCNLAIETKKELVYIEQTNLIVGALKNQTELEKLLSAHVEFSKGVIKKDQILEEIFVNKNIDPYLMNTMKILAKKYVFGYVRPIFKAVRRRLLHDFDQEYGVIWSTIPLQEKDIKTIEDKLSKKFTFHVNLVNKIDERLVGGIQVVVANQIFDLSIQGQLDKLKLAALANKMK